MYLLITRCSFFKLTSVRIKIEVSLITLLAIGVSNGHVLIIPVMMVVIVFNAMASQKYLLIAFKLKFGFFFNNASKQEITIRKCFMVLAQNEQ
jgi:hypothetical protein